MALVGNCWTMAWPGPAAVLCCCQDFAPPTPNVCLKSCLCRDGMGQISDLRRKNTSKLGENNLVDLQNTLAIDFFNHRRACAASVCKLKCVCLSVCLLLRLRTERQQNSDTNGSIATLASYNICIQKLWHEKQANKPICKLAQAHLNGSAFSVYLGGTISPYMHEKGRNKRPWHS